MLLVELKAAQLVIIGREIGGGRLFEREIQKIYRAWR
jgi:hypothetical protein